MKKLITILILFTLLFMLFPTTPIQAAIRSIDKQVTARLDDCEVYDTGTNWVWKPHGPGSSAGYLSDTVDKIETGMRFRSITIPRGTTITTAYLIFTCQASTSGTKVKTIIEGEDTNDAKAFDDFSNYKDRDRTRADVDWDNLPAWTVNGQYQSPDIRTVIQEIVNRSGWRSGNDIVLFWGDDGSTHEPGCYRAQYTYEGSPTQSARLHIEYGYTEDAPEELEELVEDLNELAYTLDIQVETLIGQANELGNATTVLNNNLTSLREELNLIRNELGTMKTTLGGKLDTMKSRLSTLETTIQALETKEKASQRVLALEESLAELKAKSTTGILDWISLVVLILLSVAIFILIRQGRAPTITEEPKKK